MNSDFGLRLPSQAGSRERPPEINTLLDELLAGMQDVLHVPCPSGGTHLVGLYLEGSLANGGFDQDSDIDFVAATDIDIEGELFLALAGHARPHPADQFRVGDPARRWASSPWQGCAASTRSTPCTPTSRTSRRPAPKWSTTTKAGRCTATSSASGGSGSQGRPRTPWSTRCQRTSCA